MLAAVIEAPHRLVVRDLPQPEPGPYQALCRLRFGAVCAGTDQHLIARHPPFTEWTTLPAVLGHESIGQVERLGAKVRHLRPGDLVTRVGTPPVGGVGIAWGGFAQWGIATDWQAMLEDGVPRAQWDGARVQQVLPPGSDPAAATMLITWRETWSFLARLGLGAGARVLILGSGGNGLAFAGHLRLLGCRASVVGGASRRAVAAALGAVLIDRKAADAAAQLAAGGPYDALIDAVGDRAGVERLLPHLAAKAILAGYGYDAPWDPAPLAAAHGLTHLDRGYDEAEAHTAVVAMWRAGLLDAAPFLTNLRAPFPLARIADAIEAVRTRTAVKSLVDLT